MAHLPFIKPKFPKSDLIAEDLRAIYSNNYYTNNGPVYYEFKKELENYLGQDIHVVVVANATIGLMLAMRAVYGVPTAKKRFVATPSFTFAAAPLAIKWCGFEPVFYDIGEDVQPSLSSLEAAIKNHGESMAGVLLTNNFGIGNENIQKWEAVLQDANLPLVIDSAPGLGATYTDGDLTGGRGKCEVFSMHATKPFGIGEGGIISTRDASLAKRLEALKNFGFNDKKETIELGLNGKITELDCAIGRRVLKEYDEIIRDRKKTYLQYVKCLVGTGVQFIPRVETTPIQFASILVDKDKRPKVLNALGKAEIDARTYYSPAVHSFSLFSKSPREGLSMTEEISSRIISLPVHPSMDKRDIERVCSVIKLAL